MKSIKQEKKKISLLRPTSDLKNIVRKNAKNKNNKKKKVCQIHHLFEGK